MLNKHPFQTHQSLFLHLVTRQYELVLKINSFKTLCSLLLLQKIPAILHEEWVSSFKILFKINVLSLEKNESGSWPADEPNLNIKLEEKPKMFSEMMGKEPLSQIKDLDQTIGHQNQSFWRRFCCCFPCVDRFFTTETYIHYY